jgi:uncharacterized protein with HEPN domain
LQDILEAVERIERYAKRGREAFERDELVQTWVVHHLQIIREAARGLSDALKTAHSEVPWPQIVAMRNVLVHAYFGVDADEVWSAVERDLPQLKRNVVAILKEMGART